MNTKPQRLSQCSSQQNFAMPSHYPPSPFHKITTPHRTRINTSTPSVPTSPITFLTAINKDKSPQEKQNQRTLLNQSPIMNRFNSRQEDAVKQKGTSPLPSMNKKVSSKIVNHAYHKSDSNEQNMENSAGCYQSFEETLKSLAEKSPKHRLQTKINQPKVKLSNNFKGILEAQQYEIQQKKSESRQQQNQQSSKSSTINHFNEKLFSSCFQSQKRKPNQPIQGKINNQPLLCMNDDGNSAKYMTIKNDQEDQRLYYCLKCTALLVNQGFVLEQINNQQNQMNNQRNQQYFEDISNKIEQCKDKISSLINDLSMRQEFQLIKMTQFFQRLSNTLEKCRIQNEEILKNKYKQKIEEYESILIEIDSFGNNLKETHLNYEQFQSLRQEILKFNLGQPFLRMYDSDSLNQMHSSFTSIMKERFTLILESKNINKQQKEASQQQIQGITNRNHGLRFSFQKLLNDISSKKTQMKNIINSLEEEEEEDSDCTQLQTEKSQKTAFRDLFPEAQDSSQINSGVNSPTFKHF